MAHACGRRGSSRTNERFVATGCAYFPWHSSVSWLARRFEADEAWLHSCDTQNSHDKRNAAHCPHHQPDMALFPSFGSDVVPGACANRCKAPVASLPLDATSAAPTCLILRHI